MKKNSRIRRFDPGSEDPFTVSRTRIQNFLDCQRCFYIQNRLAIKALSSFPFRLNSATDTLLKKSFDIARKKQIPHKYFKDKEIDLIPFKHENMDQWRENFQGVKYHYKKANLMVRGAVDEILVNKKGELSPVEFKSTQTKDGDKVKYLGKPHHKFWKNQLEIYGYLLEKNGFKISENSYIVFCNAQIDKNDEWNEKLDFDVQVIPYKIEYSWVEPTLDKIKSLLNQDTIPNFSDPDHCDVCRFLLQHKENKI